ncbi:hypothetical protein MKX03_030476 [Papaver bracteatum]|nr:hypothetical protein MKX03_030476 [Papaver bracteatum]
MKGFHSSPLLSLLCLISLIITTNSTTLLHPAASELSNSQNIQGIVTDRRTKPDKEGVYNASKDLCWGCIGESIQYLFAHNWFMNCNYGPPGNIIGERPY